MNHISFRCGCCRARIKAPLQLRGQMRCCPGCGHRFLVERRPIEDAGPVLVDSSASDSQTTLKHRLGV
jgi:DNA-directed RNA polymerase subunit RPC12/RpoP